MSVQPIVVHKQTTNVGFMDFTNFDNAIKCAELIAKSSICPTIYKGKSEDVLVAVQFGFEIGLKPLQAIQNIAVINGRPCVWGDAALAICLSKPEFEYIHEHFNEDTKVAICTVKRVGMPERMETFSMEDAKTAGLWNKQGPWSTYPKRMLQMRARGFALRDIAADWLKGLILREEAQDYPIEPVEKEVNQVADTKNVSKKLKTKLRSKNPFIATRETPSSKQNLQAIADEQSPSPLEVQQVKSAEPAVNGQTKENLFALYEYSTVFQKRIDKWLAKRDITQLEDLTQTQAQKIIEHLEKEYPEAHQCWEDYQAKKEIYEFEGGSI